MDIETTCKVTAVTVFSQQARVTVTGRVTLVTGNHQLLVGDLPLALDTNSMRAGGKGTARVRVHGVEVRRQHFAQTPSPNALKLEDRIEQLEDVLQGIEDEQSILEAQVRYLDGLRGASEQFARGLALGRTSTEEQAQFSQFFREQDQGLRADGRKLARQKREVGRELDMARRELHQITSARPPERNQAVIAIEVIDAGEFEVELTYNVNPASWKPLYDVRLIAMDANPTLVVVGIAQITQNSGQDWNGVDLKISTARTDINRRIPELKPWFVDEYRPPVPRAAPVRVQAAAAQKAMLMDAPGADQPEIEATHVSAEISTEEGGATVTYDIPGKGNIPSDGSPHKALLFESRYPAMVDYIAVPKHTDSVFRRVKATNEGATPLLAGTVQLFAGDRYIGTSRITYVPVGDAVELMLGVEERLTIERELVRREVDKTLLRDKRQTQYGYEITLKNLLPDQAAVEVQDHIPVARHEEIKVKLLACSPEPNERSDLNLMTWQLNLAGDSETKIKYEFLVEHPRSLRVAGLID